MLRSPASAHRADAARHEPRQHRLQVGSVGERVVGRPDHQALVAAFGQLDGLVQAFDDARADEVQLARDAGDEHFAVQRPDAHLVVAEEFGAALQRIGRAGAEHGLGKVLAAVDGQRAARHIGCLLYTSDAADERSSVDLGGRRIIKKKKRKVERQSDVDSDRE